MAATLWRSEREPRVEEFLESLTLSPFFLILLDLNHLPGVKVRGERRGRCCWFAFALPVSTTLWSCCSSINFLRFNFRRCNIPVDLH